MTTEQPTPDLPAEAVEAAAKAINAVETPNGVWEMEDLEDILFRRDQARAALAAAWPLLRAQIADEIDVARMDGHPAMTAEAMPMSDGFYGGMRAAAKIARGAGRG